jgi:hypothetical protein
VIQKNFPGRKNARRVRALERLENGPFVSPRGAIFRTRAERADEANTLALRIMPQERAEGIRTKKDRSGRVKFSRGAAA